MSLNSPSGTTDGLAADAIIIGGGLAGLTLALALGSAGLTAVVVDREAPPAMLAPGFDGRVSALALAAVQMLQAIGVWPLVAEAQPILDIRVSDQGSGLFVHYDHRDLGETPFGHLVENRLLRQALQQKLADVPQVTLWAPADVAAVERGSPGSGAPVRVRLADGRSARAPICIAAEGKFSPLRQAAGIRTSNFDYRQTGIVTTVEHERPHHGVAQERFLPAGPFAILPMTGNRSSLVWTERADLAPAIMALDDAAFTAELRHRFGNHLGQVTPVGPRWSYPLGLQIAERYTDHRLALIGDAAHVIHPIAGQGLNLGLRDVAALAEVLVDAARLGRDPGGADVLDEYQRWRGTDVMVLSLVTDGLNRLFSNDIAPIRIARDLGLGVVNEIPPLKKLFMRHAMGLVGDLPRLLRGEGL